MMEIVVELTASPTGFCGEVLGTAEKYYILLSIKVMMYKLPTVIMHYATLTILWHLHSVYFTEWSWASSSHCRDHVVVGVVRMQFLHHY